MGLKSFMHKKIDELELLEKISKEIADNYDSYHGLHIYLHLIDAGEGMSILDDIRYFTDLYDCSDHLHIEKHNHACIAVRSYPHKMSAFLCGEHKSAGNKISKNNFICDYKAHDSCLPAFRRSKMTAREVALAFSEISDSLQKSKGYIAK
jgi:hypothetical protein